MKATLIWQCAITAAALIGTAALASAAEPQKEDAAFSAKLFTSIENSDYDAFVADGTSAFKGITKEQFEAEVPSFGIQGDNEGTIRSRLCSVGSETQGWAYRLFPRRTQAARVSRHYLEGEFY